jgi:acyl carrier protein
LKTEIKQTIVTDPMLRHGPELIADQLLFRPGSLGLDSVDALQLVVALDRAWLEDFRPGRARKHPA